MGLEAVLFEGITCKTPVETLDRRGGRGTECRFGAVLIDSGSLLGRRIRGFPQDPPGLHKASVNPHVGFLAQYKRKMKMGRSLENFGVGRR